MLEFENYIIYKAGESPATSKIMLGSQFLCRCNIEYGITFLGGPSWLDILVSHENMLPRG